jgi:hypothetical protein
VSVSLLFLTVLCEQMAICGDPLDIWQSVRPAWCTNDLAAVVAGGNYFVAAGAKGTIITSPDGGSWFPANSGCSEYLQGVAYGNGVFVAVGWQGTILVSTNPSVWSPAISTTVENLRTVTFANGAFVAAGDSVIAASPDGLNWTSSISASSNTIFGISYGAGTYIGVGADATIADAGAIITSTNGNVWSPPIGGFSSLYGIAYGSGLFSAVGGNGPFGCQIVTSLDGQVWQQQQPPVDQFLTGIAYGNQTFVAVGGSFGPLVATSTNGLAWIKRTPSTLSPLVGVCYGRGIFVAVGLAGSILISVTSADLNPDPVPMTIRRTNNNILIGWPVTTYPIGAFLERSTSPSGPWSVLTNAAHPYEEEAEGVGASFFHYFFETY